MNAAVKCNLENAVTGVAPNYLMNYVNVLLSRGKLAKAFNPEIATATASQLDFSWSANTGAFIGAATDKAVFVVYNPAKHDFVVQMGGAIRSALEYELSLPADFAGDTVHAWIAFMSVDEKEVSTSQYVGTVIVM